MRHLFGNKHAQMGMVGAAIGLFITLIICVLIYYNIAASIDTTTIEDNVRKAEGFTYPSGETAADNASRAAWNASKPVANATGAVNSQSETFFTIAPIVGIVIVAVVVIGYVQRIGG